MGDYNPNTPTLIGSEWFPTTKRTVDLGANPLSAVAQRIMPGAVTPSNAYLWQNPGALNSLLGVELVDTLVPADLTQEFVLPGTNTGKIAAAQWVTEAGGANDFGRVAKNGDDTTYLTMTGGAAPGLGVAAKPLGVVSAPTLGGAVPLTYRGNRGATYSQLNQRVASVTMYARIASTRAPMIFQFVLEAMGGATKFIVCSGAIKPVADGQFRTYAVTLPGDPWIMATVNAALPFWSAPHMSNTWDARVAAGSPYGFGILPIDTAGGGGGTSQFQVSGMFLGVNFCTENRRYNAYPRATMPAGWSGGTSLPLLAPSQRVITFTSSNVTTALTTPTSTGATNKAGDFTGLDVGAKIIRASDGQVVGTILSVTNSTTAVLTANGASVNTAVDGYLGTPPVALSAATYYYEVLGQVAWNAKSTIQVDVQQDTTELVTAVASATGQQRTCFNLGLSNAGSFVAVASTATVGEMLPVILTVGGTTAANSQSNSETQATFGNEIRSGQINGQQVTSPGAATTYTAVKIAVGRFSQTLDPDQPLSVEIRHGAGSLTGGGSLDATATILPSQLTGTGHKATVIEVPFAASFTGAALQYVVILRSASKSGRGWLAVALDSRSDLLTAPATTTLVEGATIGGQTDGFVGLGGTVFTRYDIPVALCAAPAAPAGLAATVQAAV